MNFVGVRQTTFGGPKTFPKEERGNCFPACLASLLQIPLKDIPHFYGLHDEEPPPSDPGRDTRAIFEWAKSWGYIPCSFQLTEEEELPEFYRESLEGQLVILTGQSPRGDYYHCIIALVENGKLKYFWDPHPDTTWILTRDSVEVWLKLPEIFV